MDRRDLALELRSTLGDWFKVVQLVQQGGGDDNMLQMAWNKIGDYFWERQKASKAVQYYGQAKNVEMQVACYYQLEDYAGLEKLIGTLPDGAPQLKEIGDKFASVGMSTEAVTAYLKSGDVKSAVDSCVRDHHWEVAVQLAETHNYPDIQKVLGVRVTLTLALTLTLTLTLALTLTHTFTRCSPSTPRTSSPPGSSCMRSSSTARPSSTPRPPSYSTSSPRLGLG